MDTYGERDASFLQCTAISDEANRAHERNMDKVIYTLCCPSLLTNTCTGYYYIVYGINEVFAVKSTGYMVQYSKGPFSGCYNKNNPIVL